jgi:predicted secreted Zn-dependent protease
VKRLLLVSFILVAFLIAIGLILFSVNIFKQSGLSNNVFLEGDQKNTNLTVESSTLTKENNAIRRFGIPKNDNTIEETLDNSNEDVYEHGYQASPIVEIDRISYWVRGNDRKDLCEQILEKRGNEGDYFELGDIEFGIKYDYEIIGNSNGFTIGDYTVTTESTITVPQWESSAGASDDTHNDWNVFKKSVVKHEDRHQEILEEYAQKLVNNLNNLQYFDSRTQLKTAISDSIRSIENQMSDAHDKFDKEESEKDNIFSDFCNNKY